MSYTPPNGAFVNLDLATGYTAPLGSIVNMDLADLGLGSAGAFSAVTSVTAFVEQIKAATGATSLSVSTVAGAETVRAFAGNIATSSSVSGGGAYKFVVNTGGSIVASTAVSGNANLLSSGAGQVYTSLSVVRSSRKTPFAGYPGYKHVPR